MDRPLRALCSVKHVKEKDTDRHTLVTQKADGQRRGGGGETGQDTQRHKALMTKQTHQGDVTHSTATTVNNAALCI